MVQLEEQRDRDTEKIEQVKWWISQLRKWRDEETQSLLEEENQEWWTNWHIGRKKKVEYNKDQFGFALKGCSCILSNLFFQLF